MNIKTLSATKAMDVRFNEVDSYDIVWHGNYAIYFEEGRTYFGKQFNIDYSDFMAQDIFVPITKMEVEYLRPLVYGQRIEVETTYEDSKAAKVIFNYKIKDAQSQKLLCRGRTEQAMLNDKRELYFTIPPFFKTWKEKWLQ
jgi:acyl-CoA thioester hydrolase